MSKDLSFSARHKTLIGISSVALAAAVFFLSLVVSAIVSMAITGGVQRELSPLEFLVTNFSLVGSLALGVWSITAAHKKGYSAFFKAVGLRKPNLDDAATGFLLIAAYYAVLFVVFAVLNSTGLVSTGSEQELGFSDPTAGIELGYLFIALAVLTPIGEELLFRGFLYGRLSRFINKYIAAIIASLLFAVAHWPPIAMVDTFVLSLFMIAGFNHTKNLWVPIGMHAAKNAISVAIVFL